MKRHKLYLSVRLILLATFALALGMSQGWAQSNQKDKKLTFRSEKPTTAEKKAAAYAEYLTTGRFEVLHLRVIYTRDPERPVPYPTAPAPIAPAEATGSAQVIEAALIEDNPRASMEDLRAELRRLRERWAMLVERGDDAIPN